MSDLAYVADKMLIVGDVEYGPFSSHWAACAAMIRRHDSSFTSLGGDKASDLKIERGILRSILENK